MFMACIILPARGPAYAWCGCALAIDMHALRRCVVRHAPACYVCLCMQALLPRVVRRDMLTAVPRTQLLLRVLTAVHDAPWTDDQWREIEGCLTDEQVTELCRALTTLTGNLVRLVVHTHNRCQRLFCYRAGHQAV